MSVERKRPKLHTVAPAPKPVGPSLSLIKKALRLFRGRGVSKATRHRNARAWLASRAWLGDRHLLSGRILRGNVLNGISATWGQPGEPSVDQVFAPRRLGGK